jgi:hypothetical protein
MTIKMYDSVSMKVTFWSGPTATLKHVHRDAFITLSPLFKAIESVIQVLAKKGKKVSSVTIEFLNAKMSSAFSVTRWVC